MNKLLMVLILMPLMVWAEKWTDPSTGIQWEYFLQDDGSVSFGGWSGFLEESPTGDFAIPSTINGKSVTCISSEAFLDCRGLTSVTIPSSVKSIEMWAFWGVYRVDVGCDTGRCDKHWR